MKIAILASGGGTNLQAIIDAVEAKQLNCSIVAVISDQPSAYALERAKMHSIPVAVLEKSSFANRAAYDTALVKMLKKYGAELIVLAGFMRILSSVMTDAYPMKIINIHPSLLPAFPGLNVQKQAIEHGVKYSGCTVHFVDEGLDSGPIILQATVEVLGTDTPESLSARILKEEHRIYPAAIELIATHKLKINARQVKLIE